MINAAAVIERHCTVLMHYDKSTPPNEDEIREELESKEVEKKISGLKTLISLLLNGEVMPKLLMIVIRFCVPCDDHKVKKLLLVYWEVVEKVGPDGKLVPEMILVTDRLRNDLVHANEYIRGCTLRFLCKLKEAEILEPLVPTVKQNLEHRHAFVRRNAVLAIFAIYRSFEHLLPDGPELVERLLMAEQDPSTKRNAFLMLFQASQERAVAFLADNLDQVATYSDSLQLIVLELIRKVVRANPLEKSKYIRCILTLFNSPSPAVTYECASVLIALSSSTTAVKAAASSYTNLLASQSDNNIKLIVLERLQDLKKQHPKVVTELIMDILRALASANLDIRKKTLDITLDLVTPSTIGEVMQVLKKEIAKTTAEEGDKSADYRAMLITAIHKSATKFPDAVSTVVPILMGFLGDANQTSAVDVILFVREIVQTYPHLREAVMQKLLVALPSIQSSRVARVALWLVGEYSLEASEVAQAMQAVKACLGELPFAAADGSADGADGGSGDAPAPTPSAPAGGGRPVVLADGTYAAQSAIEDSHAQSGGSDADGSGGGGSGGGLKLRGLLLGGDFFLATVVATTLTKLALRTRLHAPPVASNLVAADVILLLTGLLRLGTTASGRPPSGAPGTQPQHMDADSKERIAVYLQVLSNPTPEMQQLCLVHCREAFATMLAERQATEAAEAPKEESRLEVNRQADDLITCRQLKGKGADASAIEFEEDDEASLSRATGAHATEDFSQRLKRVTQLTGLSDPVYAEAYVTVHSYDILLDLLVINQTSEPMYNLCLELATVGDLKLCERPQSYTLMPGENKHVKANIKVSSTETGIVFGTIVYDNTPTPTGGGGSGSGGSGGGAAAGADARNAVVLNDIHIDIMDYISPASCSDLAFRAMWAEFEWENKVAVNTDIADVNAFLEHVIRTTNMRCLTPPSALQGDAGFLAANLYAKSIFAEDALVNVSVEKRQGGKICGYIRIRSKTQGIALSLGDKITLKQKAALPASGKQ
jgi:coatomer subunit beta